MSAHIYIDADRGIVGAKVAPYWPPELTRSMLQGVVSPTTKPNKRKLEHLIYIQGVGGSSPSAPTSFFEKDEGGRPCNSLMGMGTSGSAWVFVLRDESGGYTFASGPLVAPYSSTRLLERYSSGTSSMPSVPYRFKAIDALPIPLPPKDKEEWPVQGHKDLYVRVYSTGRKVWILRYQLNGRRRRLTLGQFPEMGLRDASHKAYALRESLAEGIDPAGDVREREGTFGELCAVYLQAVERGSQKLADATLAERRRIYESADLDPIRRTPPADLTAEDVARVLDRFEKRDSMVMLNRAQQAISAVFTWAVARRRYQLTSNPVRALPRRTKEYSKRRYLSESEIAVLWRDLDPDGRPASISPTTPLIRAVLRLTLLTGQRPGEVRRIERGHIKGSTWTMPPGYRKGVGGRASDEHRVHLNELALIELNDIKARGRFMFPAYTEQLKPISHQAISRPVRRIWQRLGMEPWTPHDLRRTAMTHWTDLGLVRDWTVGEKMVGHQLPKIRQTYDRSEQWDERVEAFDAWGRKVAEIVGLR